MKKLRNFPTQQLNTLLARETVNYYKLVGFGASIEECIECNNGIKEIQTELELRRNHEENNMLLHAESPAAIETAA